MSQLYAQFAIALTNVTFDLPPGYVDDSSASLQTIGGQSYLVQIGVSRYDFTTYDPTPPMPPPGTGADAAISYNDGSGAGTKPANFYNLWTTGVSVTPANGSEDLQALNDGLATGYPNNVGGLVGQYDATFTFATVSDILGYTTVPDGADPSSVISNYNAPLATEDETYVTSNSFGAYTATYEVFYPTYVWAPVETSPSISIADAPPVIEGTTGPLFATFTVTLSAASTDTITVDYTTQDGSAKAGTDYAAESGTVTFAPGQTTATISVPVTQETIASDKTFDVVLSNPTDSNGALPTIANDTGFGTIRPGATLFTTGPDTVDFNNLTAVQQQAIANGAETTDGLGGNDVVTLPSTGSATFTTSSRAGDTYTVNGGDGGYDLTLGAGNDSVNISGNGSSTIAAGSGTDNIAITGTGQNILNDTAGGTAIVSGLFSGSATIAANSTLELKAGANASGSITFGAGTDETLKIDGTTMPTAVLSGLSTADKVDLADVPLGNLNNATILESPSQLQIVSNGTTNSFNLPESSPQDIAFFSDGNGGTKFTVTNFGVDGTADANVVLSATDTLLKSVTAIKQYQGGLTLNDYDAVFGKFFNSLGAVITSVQTVAQANAIYQQWQTAVAPADASPAQVADAYRTAVSQALGLAVKASLEFVIDKVAKVAVTAGTSAALNGIAGFAAESAIAEFALPFVIGAGVVSAPVVLGITGAFVAGAAFDAYYEKYWAKSVDAWIESKIQTPGIVINGYLSGATVFADANGNGQLDPGEAATTTDANGNFTLSGGSGPLVAFGGTDTSTGLAFKGQLSAPAGSTVITPLTTLLNDLSSDPSAEQKVLSDLGLSSSLDLTTLDPIAAAQAGDATGAAAEAAGAKVYDTVSLIASTLASAGGAFASGVKDAFSGLANAIEGTGISLTDTAGISSLLSSIAASEHLTLGQGVADAIASIITAGNAALDQVEQTDQSGTQFLKDTASVELVMQGPASTAVQQAGNNPAQIQSLVGAFTGTGLTALLAEAANQLGSDDDSGEQAALQLTVNSASSTSIGAAGASNVPFTIAGLDLEDSGTVTFTDANGSTVQAGVNGGETSYSADLSTLADGPISSSLAVNTDPAGNSFNPVLGNPVNLDQDAGEQAALSLTIGNTDITPQAASAVPFTIAGLEGSDTGSVIFTDANGKTVTINVNGSTTNYSADLSTLTGGPIESILAVNTDEAGNNFKPVAGNSVTLENPDTDTEREPPLLTIANHWLAVNASGTISLPISVQSNDPDDTVSVKISGVPNYETITAGDGHAVSKKDGSYIFTAADVLSGLTLHSSFQIKPDHDDGREHDHTHDHDDNGFFSVEAKLTVTALNSTHGEATAAFPQTITVVTTPSPSPNEVGLPPGLVNDPNELKITSPASDGETHSHHPTISGTGSFPSQPSEQLTVEVNLDNADGTQTLLGSAPVVNGKWSLSNYSPTLAEGLNTITATEFTKSNPNTPIAYETESFGVGRTLIDRFGPVFDQLAAGFGAATGSVTSGNGYDQQHHDLTLLSNPHHG